MARIEGLQVKEVRTALIRHPEYTRTYTTFECVSPLAKEGEVRRGLHALASVQDGKRPQPNPPCSQGRELVSGPVEAL